MQDNETNFEAQERQEAAVDGEEPVVSDTEPALAREMQEEAGEADAEAAQAKPAVKKLFTLEYHLPLDDYLEFYRVMNAENVQKSKKKMTVMGAIVLGVAVLLTVSLVTGVSAATPLSWVLLAVIYLLGLRNLTYYKFFYEKALVKAVTREYQKNSHLQDLMVVDFYPNKCVEHLGENRVETFWHTIHSVKETARLVMIMLEPRRCLLIPKAEIAGQLDALEKLVGEICENFEKQRYQV